ncbi:hypothetical protein [[Acholeplasma] multilocale]|uniref:hypothetical protein n=1 Tax=[Acholeplasma] multilocale TaxID=264638 RepID=UPI00047B6C1E|nr:hypothetical protein [[Acholeplasma] multilocale]
MAKVNEEKGIIEFGLSEFEAAWNNAPVLVNKDATEFRLCYICKFHLERKLFAEITEDGFAWTIDLINTKKPVLEDSNYIAIHRNCVGSRPKKDASKILKYIYATEWKFDEGYYSEK